MQFSISVSLLKVVFILQVAHYRSLYSKIISDKHDDVMAKFGAILAQGIIDAGERENLIWITNIVKSRQT